MSLIQSSCLRHCVTRGLPLVALGAAATLGLLRLAGHRPTMSLCPGAWLILALRKIPRMLVAPRRTFKLHVYDQCPFCGKVEVLLGHLGLSYERVTYGFGDFSASGPVRFNGTKALPIMELHNESAGDPLFDEMSSRNLNNCYRSLEMLKRIMTLRGEHRSVVAPRSDVMDAWMKRFDETYSPLIQPRMLMLKQYWSPEDIEYASKKYEQDGFTFEGAMRQSVLYLDTMNALLHELGGKIGSESPYLFDYGLSVNDLELAPKLRQLSYVGGLYWPKNVRAYGDFHYAGTEAKMYWGLNL